MEIIGWLLSSLFIVLGTLMASIAMIKWIMEQADVYLWFLYWVQDEHSRRHAKERMLARKKWEQEQKDGANAD